MSVFKRIFSSEGKETVAFPWIPLEDPGQLDELILASKNRPKFIFKHSTSCSLSSMILRRYEKIQEGEEVDADFYFLDLIRFRGLSNKIAEIFGLRHQSPQLLVIRDGQLQAHASHSGILDLQTDQA